MSMVYAQSDTIPKKKSKFTGLPTLGFNESSGAQVGGMAMLVFDLNKKDTISPPSSVNAQAVLTGTRSWYGLVHTKLYWNQDNWRAIFAIGHGDLNFQFYSDYLYLQNNGFIDYETITNFTFATFSRRIVDRLYGGISFSYNKMETTYYIENISHSNYPDTTKILIGVGVPFNYDSRDNHFNPSKGINADFRASFNHKVLGSEVNFNSLKLEINWYNQTQNKSIWAYRTTVYSGLGDVPFEGQRIVGRKDIRGYTKGKYRGDQIYTAQVEYRKELKKRWGYVAFAGLASSINNKKESNAWGGLLPGVGAGLRYMAIKEQRINLGIDAALGKDDWGIYFRIGEVF